MALEIVSRNRYGNAEFVFVASEHPRGSDLFFQTLDRGRALKRRWPQLAGGTVDRERGVAQGAEHLGQPFFGNPNQVLLSARPSARSKRQRS